MDGRRRRYRGEGQSIKVTNCNTYVGARLFLCGIMKHLMTRLRDMIYCDSRGSWSPATFERQFATYTLLLEAN